MYCRPKCCPTTVCPPVVSPTKCNVNHTCQNIIIPHVHPSHTTTVNHINYQHQHHFPHTTSCVNEVTVTDIGAVPGPPPAPTAGFGPMFGPGFGPGVRPRPGFFR